MSEVLRCDGCGKTTSPSEARRICDAPWFVVNDMWGGAVERHACSPECLKRLADGVTSKEVR